MVFIHFFGRTVGPHYSLFVENADINDACICTAICVIIPRNHGRVETSPQLPHRVFAERHVLILRPSRRQGRAQNNCSYENHFWWIFISTTRRWRTEYKDFWAQTLCCGNVKIKMSVRLCYNKSFELRSRFRIIWQRWRRSTPWIWSSEVFLNRIILRSGNQLLTWLSRPDCCKNSAKKLDVYTSVYCLLPT